MKYSCSVMHGCWQCSEDRVLNWVAYVIEDLVFEALCTDREQAIFEVFLQHCDVICPSLESFAHQVLCVTWQPLQPQVLWFKLGLIHFHIEQFTSHWVNASSLQLVDWFVDRLLEHADQSWLDSHRFKQINLAFCLWETVHDPSVHAAITLSNSLLNQAQKDLIRQRLASFCRLLQLHLDRWVFQCSLSD